MPNWISKNGKWFPATEQCQLDLSEEEILNKKSPIYQGPDRASVAFLKEKGVEFLGYDSITDPDLVRMAKSLNFKDVHEYLDVMGTSAEENLKNQEKKAAKIKITHINPAKQKAIKVGKGGFGSPKELGG